MEIQAKALRWACLTQPDFDFGGYAIEAKLTDSGEGNATVAGKEPRQHEGADTLQNRR